MTPLREIVERLIGVLWGWREYWLAEIVGMGL